MRTALLALCVLLVSGCAGAETASGAGGGSPDIPESPLRASAAPGAPQEFTSRAALPSCGEFSLGHGEKPPPSARSCLASAVGGQGAAELVVTSLTIEGQPIVTYYRTDRDGRIEVFIDSTRDQYGSGWVRLKCQGLAEQLLEPMGCGEAERL